MDITLVKLKTFAVVVLCGTLLGCGGSNTYAPVVSAWHQPSAAKSRYTVRPGDTLYSVAWAFDLDYRQVAEANDLQPPYRISPGEKLIMTTKGKRTKSSIVRPVTLPRQVQTKSVKPQSRPAVRTQTKPIVQKETIMKRFSGQWRWPARGRLVKKFSLANGSKGIDIQGRLGESIAASAPGVVVYSGSGVRGYGNLIIIKHDSSFLSAYAYNLRNLVTVGMRVQRGQTIATMGRNNGGKVMLHFEIRKNGRPVNPLLYLR